jgi:hypothetical protein
VKGTTVKGLRYQAYAAPTKPVQQNVIKQRASDADTSNAAIPTLQSPPASMELKVGPTKSVWGMDMLDDKPKPVAQLQQARTVAQPEMQTSTPQQPTIPLPEMRREVVPPKPAVPRELTEKEKAAQMLFAGMSSTSAPQYSSVGISRKQATQPQSQAAIATATPAPANGMDIIPQDLFAAAPAAQKVACHSSLLCEHSALRISTLTSWADSCAYPTCSLLFRHQCMLSC